MAALFSKPKAPSAPPVPTRSELEVNRLTRRDAEVNALRSMALERRANWATRGRTSLVNPGLGVPT